MIEEEDERGEEEAMGVLTFAPTNEPTNRIASKGERINWNEKGEVCREREGL